MQKRNLLKSLRIIFIGLALIAGSSALAALSATGSGKAQTETKGISTNIQQSTQPAFTKPGSEKNEAGKAIPQKQPDSTAKESISAESLKHTKWLTAAQRNISEQEYHITFQKRSSLPDMPDKMGAYHAPNRAQNLRTYFTPKGINVVPRREKRPTWNVGLKLASVGKGDNIVNLPEDDSPVVDGSRIEYHRSMVVEWYENKPEGLEQGFTVNEKIEGKGDLTLLVQISGADVKPVLSGDGQTLDFLASTNARMLRYGNLKVYDANDKKLSSRFEIADNTIKIVIADRGADYPITVDPLITVPVWLAEGNNVGAHFGASVATAGDVNGDGYDDVIVGAPHYDNGQAEEGAVFVYHGSEFGLPISPDWTAESDQAGAWFGVSVSTAGYVNDDTFSDVIVGASGYSNPDLLEGAVFVYHGSSSGLDLNGTRPNGTTINANWTAESNYAGGEFGASVSTAGDVNNDTFSDVIVGAYRYSYSDPLDGAAFVYHGSASGLGPSGTPLNADWMASSIQQEAFFGVSVSTAGDVNNDGFDDVIVGAHYWDDGVELDEGAAFVFLGSSTGLDLNGTRTIGLPANADWTAEGNQANARFGFSVSTAGYVNGDLRSDVIVGAFRYDNGETDEGMAYVYLGKDTAVPPLGTPLSALPVWTAEGESTNAFFGYSVSTAGDVNGDGYSDVIVGERNYNGGGPFDIYDGRAFVYLGEWAGLSATPGWTVEGDTENYPNSDFGFSVSTAGDVNGDGYSDVIVGARTFPDEPGEGAAFVYYGSESGADDDNDGLTDYEEVILGTDFLNPDSDGDGVDDLNDAFPLDGTETLDSDATETQITSGAVNQVVVVPDISGDRIVWHEERNGNLDIYMYDLSTETETRITTHISDQYSPAISGNRIVWKDDRNGSSDSDIYMYDLSTGTETRITTNPLEQFNPAISGDRIVWLDLRHGNSEIYMYDLSTRTETRITNDSVSQYCLDISGDRIIWLDATSGNLQIHMYDLSTGTPTQITDDVTQNIYGDDISGDRIVWYAAILPALDHSDIYMYDLSTGTTTQITTNPFNQSNPVISGDRIVWTDDRNGNPNIYMYDLSTGTPTQITTDTGPQEYPVISGDNIVWMDGLIGYSDVYLYTGDDVGDNIDNCPGVYNPGQEDTDNDGIGDACEDLDIDGMDDNWERLYFGDTSRDGTGDFDYDGLTDLDEFLNGIDPTNPDTDDDCYTDYQEVIYGTADDATNPNTNPPDADDDCITDAEELLMDSDLDGINNFDDNCENTPNDLQLDSENGGVGDGVGDVCDNCPNTVNADQADADEDGVGDVCDNAPGAWNPGQEDHDSDGIPDVLDNCPQEPNPKVLYNTGDSIDDCAISNNLVIDGMWQPDNDCDGLGDTCDGDDWSTKPKTDPDPPPPDGDGDGIADDSDNCPVPNPQQTDTDGDGEGDACDNDDDEDGIDDPLDTCPLIPDPTNNDEDNDGLGDVCDDDDDGDGILDACDSFNYPDAPDSDGDGVIDACDNCIDDPNPDQADNDGNGVGNACEPTVRINFTLTDPDDGTPYEDWLPEDGRQAEIHATLVDLDGTPLPPDTPISLTLESNLTSNLPGKYLNHDPNGPNAGEYNTDPDYAVLTGEGTDTITIQSHDYGGKTVIRATTSYGGENITGVHRVPKDNDDDGLPDKYELDTTLNPSGDLNPAINDSDSDGTPDNREDEEGTADDDPGDGLTAFEEYRGVMWEDSHHRLSAERKDLFVCGVDFAEGMFGIGSAYANAGVDVHWIETVHDGSVQWGGIVENFEHANLSYVIIRSHDSEWSGGDLNSGHIRRIGKRKWDIPVLGESYFGGDASYGQPTKVFATSISNYLNDRPYRDGGAFVGDTPVVEPDDLLNPTSDASVEDKDDDGVPDKKEDADKNGTLDGDMLETAVSTWGNPEKLNPFNINDNLLVELPQQTDGDPENVPAGDEYNELPVFIHVITHELGHAVGMGVEGTDPNLVDDLGHCFDQNCVMYQYSIDWKREDQFCPYHQGLIRIQNYINND